MVSEISRRGHRAPPAGHPSGRIGPGHVRAPRPCHTLTPPGRHPLEMVDIGPKINVQPGKAVTVAYGDPVRRSSGDCFPST